AIALARPSGEPPRRMTKAGIGPVGATHVPVMCGVVVEGLRPRPDACLVDGTLGAGGHAAALLAAAPGSRLLGLDHDPTALALAGEALQPFGTRVVLRQGSFTEIGAGIKSLGWDGADGILLDLGVSSMQLDTAGRGFSFQREGPLDMRMD